MWKKSPEDVMHWLWFLIIGVVAGWLSGKLMRGHGFGLLGDLVVGIVRLRVCKVRGVEVPFRQTLSGL